MMKRIREAQKRVDKRQDAQKTEDQENNTLSETKINQLIVSMLDAADPQFRRKATLDLINAKDTIDLTIQSRIGSFLLKALHKESDDSVRQILISGLGEYNIQNSITPIHDILMNRNTSTDVRASSVATLGKLKSKNSIGLLESILKSDESEEVKYEAKLALSIILD
jgi:HEAT repeat protein